MKYAYFRFNLLEEHFCGRVSIYFIFFSIFSKITSFSLFKMGVFLFKNRNARNSTLICSIQAFHTYFLFILFSRFFLFYFSTLYILPSQNRGFSPLKSVRTCFPLYFIAIFPIWAQKNFLSKKFQNS